MKNFRSVVFGAAFILTAGLPSVSSAAVIYQNDFEANASGFTGTTTVTSYFGSNWLGPLNQGQTATLQLSGLVTGTTYDLAFDLLAAGSLDGPGDYFRVFAGGQTLLDASFDMQGYLGGQTYSDGTPLGNGGNHAAHSGRDVSLAGADIYYFGHGAGNPVLTFTATGATMNIDFVGDANQPSYDERFAIDNIIVTGEVAVPEPAALGLLALGLAGLGFRRRRKA